MREKLKKFFFGIFPFVFILCISLMFQADILYASEIENSTFIKKVSRSYTKKFCNAIGFGLSKDSAMAFANKENNMIFKNRNGFDNLNKELIANKIAVSVIENCGYPINLKGEKGIEEFEKDYISMNELDSQ